MNMDVENMFGNFVCCIIVCVFILCVTKCNMNANDNAHEIQVMKIQAELQVEQGVTND